MGQHRVGLRATAETSEEVLDAFDHRTLEVEAFRHLRPELDRIPEDERHGVWPIMVGPPTQQVVRPVGVPHDEGTSERATGLVGRNDELAGLVIHDGGEEPLDETRGTTQAKSLAGKRGPEQVDQHVSVEVVAKLIPVASLVDGPAVILCEPPPHRFLVGQIIDDVAVVGGLAKAGPMEGEPVVEVGSTCVYEVVMLGYLVDQLGEEGLLISDSLRQLGVLGHVDERTEPR